MPYDSTLIDKAINIFPTLKRDQATWTENGYKFFQTLTMQHAAEFANKLFTYQYRDTDPFEKQLGYEYQEGSGDGGVVTDGTNALRQRQGDFVELLHQCRKIGTGPNNLDRMGFKGVLQFSQANTEFAMQISLCNIVSQMDKSKNAIWPKYGNDNPDDDSKTCSEIPTLGFGGSRGLYNFNEIKSEWSNHDIDIPLTFRVIADMKDGDEKFVEDFKKFYPHMDTNEIKNYFFNPQYLLSRNRKNIFVM